MLHRDCHIDMSTAGECIGSNEKDVTKSDNRCVTICDHFSVQCPTLPSCPSSLHAPAFEHDEAGPPSDAARRNDSTFLHEITTLHCHSLIFIIHTIAYSFMHVDDDNYLAIARQLSSRLPSSST